jgi:hypothetical protein
MVEMTNTAKADARRQGGLIIHLIVYYINYEAERIDISNGM